MTIKRSANGPAGASGESTGEAPRNGDAPARLIEAQLRIADLEMRLQRAEQAAQDNASFLAMMSHELRTPLNAIIGFSDAALRQIRGALPPAYEEYFRDIHSAGEHLAELIDSVLDVARLEGNHIKLSVRPVSARLLVAEARAMVALRAEQDGVDIGPVEIQGDWLLHADPIRMRQIFVNLLSNAIKFTPPGGTVGIDAARLHGDIVDITVWDTGIGIDETQQDHVFDAFYQVPGAELRGTGKGAGLGLAISRQLAQLMGGDILLQSAPGKGSRFTVRLPLVATGRSCAVAGG
jgi:signal transduction histidine kinase